MISQKSPCFQTHVEEETDLYLKSVAQARLKLYEKMFVEAYQLLSTLNKEIEEIIATNRFFIIAKAFRSAVYSSSNLFKNNQALPTAPNINNNKASSNRNGQKPSYREIVNKEIDSPAYGGARSRLKQQPHSMHREPIIDGISGFYFSCS